ncbi:MAG: alpha/beta hydrolase [Saprospiraceae bacterium]|nr:alpha/beta hydrolase [Saprospiraceae bacterium]MBP7699325.1 alpha/beta hydrolase [Saprospiraceae bacterium]
MYKSKSIEHHPFLLAKAMRITTLKRRRKIWAFLPKDYHNNSTKSYPVIYFNDAQNIFEGWKAPFGKSWEVHNTMKELAHHLNLSEHILIGIEHGKKYRHGEYVPFARNGKFAKEGNAYADFVANDLKNFVDKKLRTIPWRESNAIVGSSLGGLSALYIGYKHQDVFAKVGVFSPSLWIAPPIYDTIRQYGKHYASKFYISVGSREGHYTLKYVNDLYQTFLQSGYLQQDVKLNIVPNGQHNEQLWQKEFRNFYTWISQN